MGNTWPMVPLEQVLAQSSEVVEIEPDRRYRQVTVRLWGGGVVLRNELSGARISAKKRRVARAEQFILSRIDARNGAFGLVPESLEGAVVSNDFPSFNINRQSLEPRFLEWMSKTEDFVKLCRAASEGTTNRVRLQVDRFLATPIPLPPLDEQRRIVARIEELAALIDEAQELRAKARQGAVSTMGSAVADVFERADRDGWDAHRIRAISTMATGTTPPSDREEYFGGDVPFVCPGDLGEHKVVTRSARTLTRQAVDDNKARVFEEGTLLLVAIGASLGKVGVCARLVTANQQITGMRFADSVIPEYAYWWFKSQHAALRRAAPAATLPILNQARLGDLLIRVPPLAVQSRICSYLDGLQAQVDELTALQDATQAELDALLPSVLDRAFKGEL